MIYRKQFHAVLRYPANDSRRNSGFILITANTAGLKSPCYFAASWTAVIIQHTLSKTQNSADDLLSSAITSSEKQLPQLSVATPTVLSEPWAAGKSHADHVLRQIR